MMSREPLSPEAFAVRYVMTTTARPRASTAFIAERYPVEQFRVWPEGAVDTQDYSKGANVSVESRYTSSGHALGSVVTARVYAEDGDSPQRVSIESELYVPPLCMEMEGKMPSDERTLRILQGIAAVAVAARATLQHQ